MRCPECGLMDYIDMRVEMHKAVIYQCRCGHSWKKQKPQSRWISPDIDMDDYREKSELDPKGEDET